MINSLQNQFKSFRLMIFQIKRINFLNEGRSKKKSPKKSESNPPKPQSLITNNKVILSQHEQNILKQLKERNIDSIPDYCEVNNQDFEYFSEMRQRRDSMKDILLNPIYDLDIYKDSVKMTEDFKALPHKLTDIKFHPQIRENLERMQIIEMNFLQTTLFNLISDKSNVCVKTSYPHSFGKSFSFIFPSVNMILNKLKIPPQPQDSSICSPFTIFLEKDKEISSEIYHLTKLISHETGIKVLRYNSQNTVKRLSSAEILVTSMEKMREFMKKNLLHLDHLENIVILNYDDFLNFEKIFIELNKDVKELIKITVYSNKEIEHSINSKNSVINDFYLLSYYLKDSIKENYRDRKIAENNERISHLAIAYDETQFEEIFEKIKNMLKMDGLKIIQVQDSSHLASIRFYLQENNILFNIVNEQNSSNIIIRGNLIITRDIVLITEKNIKEARFIININIPIRIKNFFTLVGSYGENMTSTLTFIEKNKKDEKTKEYTGILKEYKQTIPEFLN